MKKLSIVLFLSVLAVSNVFCDQGKWSVKGMFGGMCNITNVSDNWSGKEKSGQNWNAKLDVTAQKDDINTNWLNSLQEEYGRTKVYGTDEQTSADQIDANSVYTKKLSYYVNPFVALNINTQNWKFADPITYTESLGNGVWIINKPEHILKTRVGLAFKQKFARVYDVYNSTTAVWSRTSAIDNPNTVEVEDFSAQTGCEWVTNYEIAFLANTKFVSEAKVFSGFDGGATLRWDSSLYIKLSSIITTQLNYLAIYDFNKTPKPTWPQDIEKRLTILFGVSYNLF